MEPQLRFVFPKLAPLMALKGHGLWCRLCISGGCSGLCGIVLPTCFFCGLRNPPPV